MSKASMINKINYLPWQIGGLGPIEGVDLTYFYSLA